LEGGRPLLSAQIGCWVAESEVADLLATTERTHEGCQIGSYPFFREGRTGANFVVRAVDSDTLDRCVTDLGAALEQGGWPVVAGGI
jgi:molybdopterin-biosynthesis enzyme MoeA-like protein